VGGGDLDSIPRVSYAQVIRNWPLDVLVNSVRLSMC
jgi:hypothetical protein